MKKPRKAKKGQEIARANEDVTEKGKVSNEMMGGLPRDNDMAHPIPDKDDDFEEKDNDYSREGDDKTVAKCMGNPLSSSESNYPQITRSTLKETSQDAPPCALCEQK